MAQVIQAPALKVGPAHPQGPVAVYLTALNFAMGTYLAEHELEELRRAGTRPMS